MTLSEAYRQTINTRKPCLDYPYIGIPDEDDDTKLLNYGNSTITH